MAQTCVVLPKLPIDAADKARRTRGKSPAKFQFRCKLLGSDAPGCSPFLRWSSSAVGNRHRRGNLRRAHTWSDFPFLSGYSYTPLPQVSNALIQLSPLIYHRAVAPAGPAPQNSRSRLLSKGTAVCMSGVSADANLS